MDTRTDRSSTMVLLGQQAGAPEHGQDSRSEHEQPGEHERPAPRDVIVLGSGNLGLVYLIESPHRLSIEEINRRHPRLLPALREHAHIGFVLVASDRRGPLVLGARGSRELRSGRIEGEDPLAGFSANAAAHLLRTDGFAHAPDILVNSFYDPALEQGCAFEELISFHGGLGGPQTQPFILHPAELPTPDGPVVGAVAVHELLKRWRDFDGVSAGGLDATVAVTPVSAAAGPGCSPPRAEHRSGRGLGARERR